MKQDMVQKVLEWPIPTTVKELVSFLRFASYYRLFIPQFAALTTEMSLQRRKKQLEWTDTMEKKFRELKEHFSRTSIRAYPDYGDNAEPLEVWPYFSGMMRYKKTRIYTDHSPLKWLRSTIQNNTVA